jgi:hypothetical protein
MMESKQGRAFPLQSFMRQTQDPHSNLGMSEAVAEHVSQAFTYLGDIAALGLAPLTAHEPCGDVFLGLSIEGVRFHAYAETNPFVARQDAGDWCQLGVATIDRSCGLNGTREQWMVCKYGPMEGRLDLSMLSDAGRRSFAIAFGVPIGPRHRASSGAFAFYASPALHGLVAWARRRPRKFAAEPGVSSYLGDWKSVVTHCMAHCAAGG